MSGTSRIGGAGGSACRAWQAKAPAPPFPRACLAVFFALLPLVAAVRVENPAGDIRVHMEWRKKVDARCSVHGRETRPGDLIVKEENGDTLVRAQPADGAAADLDIALPYRAELTATTAKGAISFTGLIFKARLVTGEGDIRVTAPWGLTRLEIASQVKPASFARPKTLRGRPSTDQGNWGWMSNEEGRRITCCDIRISGQRPGRIELADMDPPPDSPVKPFGQARAVLDAIFGGGLRTGLERRSGEPEPPPAPPHADGSPVFVSNVRLVDLEVAAYGRDGRPAAGLRPEDFEVTEDGAPQELVSADAEGPFNVALLLDFNPYESGHDAMKEAMRQFLAIARPRDRIAVYSTYRGYFQVESRLMQLPPAMAWEALADQQGWSIRGGPVGDWVSYFWGGGSLYDAVVLACDEELLKRPRERNALVIVGDMADYSVRFPQAVSFQSLRRAAEEMPILLYPVEMPFYAWTAKEADSNRANLQALADASGGRMFRVNALAGLKDTAAQVADELRSVYTIAYYPKNQAFDGKWREIEVHVKRPGVTLRTRRGYYAW